MTRTVVVRDTSYTGYVYCVGSDVSTPWSDDVKRLLSGWTTGEVPIGRFHGLLAEYGRAHDGGGDPGPAAVALASTVDRPSISPARSGAPAPGRIAAR